MVTLCKNEGLPRQIFGCTSGSPDRDAASRIFPRRSPYSFLRWGEYDGPSHHLESMRHVRDTLVCGFTPRTHTICRWRLLEHTSSLARRRWTTPRTTRRDSSTMQRRCVLHQPAVTSCKHQLVRTKTEFCTKPTVKHLTVTEHGDSAAMREKLSSFLPYSNLLTLVHACARRLLPVVRSWL